MAIVVRLSPALKTFRRCHALWRTRGSGQQAREAVAEDLLGVAGDLADEVGGGLDAFDEAGGLADHDGAAVGVAGLGGLGELGADLAPAAAQLAVAADPLLDEAVAANADVGAGPHLAVGDVRDVGDDRVVAVALDDGLLESL